jgi:hypothetical protein
MLDYSCASPSPALGSSNSSPSHSTRTFSTPVVCMLTHTICSFKCVYICPYVPIWDSSPPTFPQNMHPPQAPVKSFSHHQLCNTRLAPFILAYSLTLLISSVNCIYGYVLCSKPDHKITKEKVAARIFNFQVCLNDWPIGRI